MELELPRYLIVMSTTNSIESLSNAAHCFTILSARSNGEDKMIEMIEMIE